MTGVQTCALPIYGVGEVVAFDAVGENRRLVVRAPRELAKYIARKGSISVQGVSLTVNRVAGAELEINLIPHTLEMTTLQDLAPGARFRVGAATFEIAAVIKSEPDKLASGIAFGPRPGWVGEVTAGTDTLVARWDMTLETPSAPLSVSLEGPVVIDRGDAASGSFATEIVSMQLSGMSSLVGQLIGLPAGDRAAILGGNLARLFPLAPGPSRDQPTPP